MNEDRIRHERMFRTAVFACKASLSLTGLFLVTLLFSPPFLFTLAFGLAWFFAASEIVEAVIQRMFPAKR
jgi:hypothetical protein